MQAKGGQHAVRHRWPWPGPAVVVAILLAMVAAIAQQRVPSSPSIDWSRETFHHTETGETLLVPLGNVGQVILQPETSVSTLPGFRARLNYGEVIWISHEAESQLATRRGNLTLASGSAVVRHDLIADAVWVRVTAGSVVNDQCFETALEPGPWYRLGCPPVEMEGPPEPRN